MFGPCGNHVWLSFTSRPARALIFTTLDWHDLRPISLECLFFGTMSGPCWHHSRPGFTSKPARALIFLRLTQHHVRHLPLNFLFSGWGPCLASHLDSKIFKTELTRNKAHVYRVSIFVDHVRTMLWPCLAYFYFQTSIALKFSGLSQHGLRPMSMVCLIEDHVRTMWGHV